MVKLWVAVVLYIVLFLQNNIDFGFCKPYISKTRSATMWLRYDRECTLLPLEFFQLDDFFFSVHRSACGVAFRFITLSF